jgi:exodeoxyribonuclease V alpha subunit
MQVENNYDRDVYNGDLGVDMEEGEISVDFDSREVIHGFSELDELILAYARRSTRARARNIRLS